MINTTTAGELGFTLQPKADKVCAEGDFIFAATAMEHTHLYSMCGALRSAGGYLKWVYDNDRGKCESMLKKFPEAKIATGIDQILEDKSVRMIAAAGIPSERGPLGVKVMNAGKDYFTDKTPFTSLSQLDEARRVAKQTGCKYMVYYSERLHSECSTVAYQMVQQGAVGKVVNIIGLGPHRLGNPEWRPDWFYKRAQYGGIICDIGSHQCEQFLAFSGEKDGSVNFARAVNAGHPQFPELEDFGEVSLTGANGTSCYFRADWFTPDGLKTWGDGRTVIMGTEGTIEMRKYIDIATDFGGDRLYFINGKHEVNVEVKGTAGCPFFGQLIRDSLDRTETAMTQEHAFKAAEICLKAQLAADNFTK